MNFRTLFVGVVALFGLGAAAAPVAEIEGVSISLQLLEFSVD